MINPPVCTSLHAVHIYSSLSNQHFLLVINNATEIVSRSYISSQSITASVQGKVLIGPKSSVDLSSIFLHL